MNLGERIFHIFYNSSYYFLYVILLALVVVTPGDTIRQAWFNNTKINIFVIAGAYTLTFCCACTVWAFRLWTNKSVLASIPKTWVPVEKDDVTKNVRKMIVNSLTRSAVIAWDARPRIEPAPEPDTVLEDPEPADSVARPNTEVKETKGRGIFHRRRTSTENREHVITIHPALPVWGVIEHDGWSSPASPDLPNLQYTSVILELPHLIEARAVSVAPPDPSPRGNPPLPDARVVDVLQRPASTGLRDYISHLISLGIITSPQIATDFLHAYEHARFSAKPLSETEFRQLLKLFADLLQSTEPLSQAMLASLDIDPPESDIDDDASSTSTPHSVSQRSIASVSSRSGSEGTIRTARSRGLDGNGPNFTQDQEQTPGLAPGSFSTPRSKKRVLSKSPSIQSFSQSRKPYAGSSSSTSLRSSRQGSVIRLSPDGEGTDLPYTLTIPGAR